MTLARAGAVMSCMFCLALAGACSGPTDEQQIRTLLKDAAAALERGDVDGAAGALSDAYADEAGRTKRDLVRMAAFALREGRVKIWLGDAQVDVRGADAVVRLQAFAIRTAGKVEELADLVPSDARRFDLVLSLQRDGRRWRVGALDGDGIPAVPF
jgi:hypothetical protein